MYGGICRCASCYTPFHDPPDVPQCIADADAVYKPPAPPGPHFYPTNSP